MQRAVQIVGVIACWGGSVKEGGPVRLRITTPTVCKQKINLKRCVKHIKDKRISYLYPGPPTSKSGKICADRGNGDR